MRRRVTSAVVVVVNVWCVNCKSFESWWWKMNGKVVLWELYLASYWKLKWLLCKFYVVSVGDLEILLFLAAQPFCWARFFDPPLNNECTSGAWKYSTLFHFYSRMAIQQQACRWTNVYNHVTTSVFLASVCLMGDRAGMGIMHVWRRFCESCSFWQYVLHVDTVSTYVCRRLWYIRDLPWMRKVCHDFVAVMHALRSINCLE